MGEPAKKEVSPLKSVEEADGIEFSATNIFKLKDILGSRTTSDSGNTSSGISQPSQGTGPLDVGSLRAEVELVAIFSKEAGILASELNRYIKFIFSKHPELKKELLAMKKLVDQHADIKSILEKSFKK